MDQGAPVQSYQLELCPAARLPSLGTGLSQVGSLAAWLLSCSWDAL